MLHSQTEESIFILPSYVAIVLIKWQLAYSRVYYNIMSIKLKNKKRYIDTCNDCYPKKKKNTCNFFCYNYRPTIRKPKTHSLVDTVINLECNW